VGYVTIVIIILFALAHVYCFALSLSYSATQPQVCETLIHSLRQEAKRPKTKCLECERFKPWTKRPGGETSVIPAAEADEVST